ncbi:Malate dehydrogenase (oxaloacetate- decarboxylating) [Denitrovibrio acetiphilus DSM 12809]|uniref:Malate dehydrogenase (Oxaloacetate-decarboxylating) n=1 Tax=Denitrovibrio acetiphilus (strain DSM 12809 / NBRC 114555 / N2460) TaxID=522772 RepID=D4H7I9_DENA2|nr:malic enzyme-like NAD(P)-binding protein [Denitrovibrio acetiphilus]ADD67988.1 Malate dehydrogenase (oxaloacetate- decarboxylating) [Denitrovibrio acetiphilus DSM 12809]
MRIEYSNKVIKTLRIKIIDKPGYLGNITSIIGANSTMIGDIKTVHLGKGYKIRDIDIYADENNVLDNILSSIKDFEGADVIEVVDVVEKMHVNGKIAVKPTVDINSIDDLKIIYTPGVASICKKIHDNKALADKYTSIRNNVAIVTNGTAILGLGDIGAVAGMPVMEGKALLFSLLAGINGFPILLETHKPEEIIETVKHIAPTFGAIKLEDIKAPECFEIEDKLDAMLDIPVLHDDQHGTAVVVLAALLNIAKYTFVNLKESSVGIIGLGAAGTGIMKLLKSYGIKEFNGVDLDKSALERFESLGGSPKDLRGVVEQSKIVIATTGCPDLITPDMIQPGHVILALSNPNPEIDPDLAMKHGAIFAADGKSVNNALAFPGLFKGALQAHAFTINNQMKIAAAKTIASFALEGDLVPNILDKKVHEAVAKDVEAAAYRTGVAKIYED